MRNKQKNGFTLVELLIAMVVGLTILLAISSMMDIGLKSSSGAGRKILTQQDARAVLDIMAMEIGMASYNPTMSTTIWGTFPTGSCTSIAWPTIGTAKKGIQVATSDRIVIGMDLTDPPVDPAVIGDSASEYIEYSYVGNTTTGTIFRNIGGTPGCSGDTAILGGAGSETMVVNGTVTPLFQYFNVAGTDISATVIATPNATQGNGGIIDIRRIRINIIADVETQKGSAFRTTRRTYTTDVLVRNHAM